MVEKMARTPEQLVEVWRTHLQATGYKPTVVRQYPLAARQWLAFLAEHKVSYDVADSDHADGWISRLRSVDNLGLWTIRCKVSMMRTWYKWLKRKRYVVDSPFDSLERIRTKPKLVTPLSEGEIQRLIEHARTPQNRALWEVFYATGGRISSVVNIKLQDLALEARRIHFTTLKGGGELIGHLTPTAVEAIKVYLDWRRARLKCLGAESDWLWIGYRGGSRMSCESLRDRLRSDAKRAGVEGRVHPHRIRHSVATHLLERGASIHVISEFLGHASIITTAHYAKVSVGMLQREIAKAHPRANGTQPAEGSSAIRPAEVGKWTCRCQNPLCKAGEGGKPATFMAFVLNKRYCSKHCRYQSRRIKAGMATGGRPAVEVGGGVPGESLHEEAVPHG